MATIIQKEVFKNTTKKSLYELYMNAEKHSLISGGPVEIADKVGTSFTAFGDYITGRNLMLIKNELIVQSWRGSDWDKEDSDSVFMISLEQKGKDAVLNMVHANVPDKQEENLAKGWIDYYWNPWKQHLEGKTVTRPEM
jgi:activator of HSP90 ATPase